MSKSSITDEEFIEITEHCQTMTQASKLCGMSYRAYSAKANALGIAHKIKNQGGKGTKKKSPKCIETSDILAGKYPHYQTYKLKIRLIDEGYFEDKCQICGWNKKPEGAKYTPCELDHIDGNPTNHNLTNLRLICPNCHALTKTYRFRRGKTHESLGRKLLDENDAKSQSLTDS